MIEESNYCTDTMKKYFSKELVMTKRDNEGFKNSPKCCICDHDYVEGDVKVRDFHITGKHRNSVLHIEIVISVLNHKIPVVFHILLCKNLANSILK